MVHFVTVAHSVIRGSCQFPIKKVVSFVLLSFSVVLGFYCGGLYLTLRSLIMLLNVDALI